MTAEENAGDYAAARALVRPWIRPQTLVLTFCANHVLLQRRAVFSRSFVDVLGRVGVGEHAARSTLARMTRRGLLRRHRRGKRVYLGLTERAASILESAAGRVWDEGPVNRRWNGTWTLLGFSLPESRRGDRHLLRARLMWQGFGMLQNGLWIAPGEVDVAELLTDLDVIDNVNVFVGKVLPPTNTAATISSTWDLDALATRYRQFLQRWDTACPLPDAPDDLSRQLWLGAEWLLLVREDPRLPLEHLPADWPAVRAEHVAIRLREAYERSAGCVVEQTVDSIECPPAA